jgi:hypothetical protein
MRMLSLFHKRGFSSVVRREEDVVFLRKTLVDVDRAVVHE